MQRSKAKVGFRHRFVYKSAEDWHWGGWLVGYDGGHALRGITEAGRVEGSFDSPGFVIFIALLVEF
jgi:hypothetical protein